MLTVAVATIVVLTVASLVLLFWPEAASSPVIDSADESQPQEGAMVEDAPSPGAR